MPIEPSALRKERRGSLCAFVPMRTLTVARGMGHLIVGETLILSRQKHKEVGEGISGSKRPRRANHDRARNKSRTIEVYIRTITFLEMNPQMPHTPHESGALTKNNQRRTDVASDSEASDNALDADGLDRRNFLSCMAWVGTGLLWTVNGGIPRSSRLGAESTGRDSSSSCR